MRKVSTINNEIMTMPQLKASYEELAMKIAKLEKKFDKQFGKIFEILDKLTKHEK